MKISLKYLALAASSYSFLAARGHNNFKSSSALSVSNDDPISTKTTLKLSKLVPEEGFFIYDEVGRNTGYSVSSGGDVNGDGFDDIIIGDPKINFVGTGTSYLIYGRRPSLFENISLANLTNTQGFSIVGTNLNGRAVNIVGDVNGDGFDDIIIGVPTEIDTSNPPGQGTSYIIFGNHSIPSTIYLSNFTEIVGGFSVVGSYAADGYAVSGAGDVNNDTYADIIIGNPYASMSYVIFGNHSMPSTIYLSNFTEVVGGFSVVGVPGFSMGNSVRA